MAVFADFGGGYFLLSIFFLPLMYFIFKKFNSKCNPPLPPGPTPWPFLGNLVHMGTMPHVALANLAQIHGPLILLRLGTRKMVVGSSPTAASEILKTHDRILSARYIPKILPLEREELNNCSMAWAETCNDGWNSLRTLFRTELFSTKALDAQSCLREKKVSEMIQHLQATNDGGVADIGELVFATAFNLMSNLLLSRDLIGLNEKSEDGGMKGLVRAIVEIAGAPNVSDLYPILSKFDLQGLQKKAMKLGTKIRAIWEPIIEERRKAGTALTQNDFLDVLLKNNFNNDRINQLFLELFTAGTETSASTIEWAMAELTRSPKCMEKVREELDSEIATNSVKESSLMRLPYLQACIKETLRLHPPTPLLLPHLAPEACQVMNYTIPKNAQIMVNVWAIGRDPSSWDEPLKFKPERFLNSTVDFKGNDFELIPFGAGRRICPGLPLVARNVPLVLAALLHSFEWSLPSGMKPQDLDMKEKFGVTLMKEQPLQLIPKPKN